jgi:hypothetical protein
MTPQDYLNLAYSKSKKNQPGKIVAETTEGLDIVNRVIRMFCQIGVRVNPSWFMDEEDVAYAEEESTSGPGWPRPADAEAVVKITMDDGTEVVVVPWDDVIADSGKPAVVRRAQSYRPAGNSMDPGTDEVLTFMFVKRPYDAAATDEEVDPIFPEAYAELVAYEVAAVMALKDARKDELPDLARERDNWLRMYIAFLQHETMNEVRRWDTRFNLPSTSPILLQLAGGSSVEMPVGSA